MSNKVAAGLEKFSEGDISVKLCSTMFGVLPFAPEYKFYRSIDEAAARLGASPEQAARAQEIAASEDVAKAVWVADALDTSDKLIAGFAGVKNLFSIFSGEPRKRTFESDQEQATDAALKGVGLAYMIYKLFPGEITQKISNFKDLPAGQEAALFYVTGEVALPFADNVAEGGAGLIDKLMNGRQTDIASKFSGFAGADAVQQATQVMGQLSGTLDAYVGQAKEYTSPMMDKIKGILPSASTVANVADSASGAVASGIDLLPIWSLLGSRLAAEACVQQAMKG